jgi:hypothetical protein
MKGGDGMRHRLIAWSLGILAAASPAAGAVWIDDFTAAPYTLNVNLDGGFENLDQVGLDPASVFGGQRVTSIDGASPTEPASIVLRVDTAPPGKFSYVSTGQARALPLSLRFGPLTAPAPIDLLAASVDAFEVRVLSADFDSSSSSTAFNFIFDLDTGQAPRSPVQRATVPLVDSATPYSVFVPFASFSGEPNFSTVHSISFVGNAVPPETRFELDYIRAVPEPAGAVALLVAGAAAVLARRRRR